MRRRPRSLDTKSQDLSTLKLQQLKVVAVVFRQLEFGGQLLNKLGILLMSVRSTVTEQTLIVKSELQCFFKNSYPFRQRQTTLILPDQWQSFGVKQRLLRSSVDNLKSPSSAGSLGLSGISY